ncbi:hypothetical protein SB658_22320, partial [Bacillus sp. SIMBA_008]|uniref:hypothetical protein n=1 Tax=Bacillus sp. SIMBA_008 TaxID=3085757 RepID=UPI00397A0B61
MRKVSILSLSFALLAACSKPAPDNQAAVAPAQPPAEAVPAQGTKMASTQVPDASHLTQPDKDTVLHEGYVRTVGQMAYLWGWPMVNMINRRATITQAPHPGLLDGVLPVAPRGQIAMLHDY